MRLSIHANVGSKGNKSFKNTDMTWQTGLQKKQKNRRLLNVEQAKEKIRLIAEKERGKS